MHSLTICFGPTGTVWNLLFKDGEKANALYKDLFAGAAFGTDLLNLVDDFGVELGVRTNQIHSIMLEDLDASQQGQIERGLHNARSQAKAQQRAMADPAIRTAAMAQGPAVLSGGMPNGRFNG